MAKDHIVPQFYLRYFHNSNSNGLVFSYEKGNTKPFESSISKQIGFLEDYYTIQDSEHRFSTDINNLYIGDIENDASRIIRKINNTKDLCLNNKEKTCLSRFVANLAARNPMVHKFFKNESINEFMDFSKSLVSQKIPIELDSILTVSEFNEIISKSEENFVIEVDDSNGENKSIYRAILPLIQSELLSRRLFYYNWRLLVINTEKFFITSDNPVVFLRTKLPDKYLLRKNPVFLPLSPKIALLIHPYPDATKRVYIDDDDVINFYVKKSLSFANKLVFAHSKSMEIQELFNLTNLNTDDFNYQYNFFSHNQLKFLIENNLIEM